MRKSGIESVRARTLQFRKALLGLRQYARLPQRLGRTLLMLGALAALAVMVPAPEQNAAGIQGVLPVPAVLPVPVIVAPPCTGEQIFPGMGADAIQNLVDARPAGTVFCFASGTYLLTHYIILKDGNQMICPVRRTCVLTGLDHYRGAIAGDYGTSHQVIRGFVVEHFAAFDETWPIGGLQLRDFGLIEDNEVRYNVIGVEVLANQTIRGNFIHHNTVLGVTGGPGDNIIIDSNEIAWNNTARLNPNDSAGGSKIVGSQTGTHNLTWRRNYVHDNYGTGIWSDGNVHNTLYEANVIENNGGPGIVHEISWDAVVRNNVLRNNNTFEQGMGASCWHGAQIYVNNSQNVVIAGNSVEGVGINPICIANSMRQETGVFPQALANVTVSGNIIKMRGAVSFGLVGDTPAVGVTFIGNVYYVGNLADTQWTFMTPMTPAQWQAAGHDITGRFLTW